jgi:hypothetical protein
MIFLCPSVALVEATQSEMGVPCAVANQKGLMKLLNPFLLMPT